MFKKLKRKFVLWLFQFGPYNKFAKDILPKIYLAKKNNITKEQAKIYLNEVLRLGFVEGVVISSRDPHKLSGVLVPTDLDHSALLVGYDYALEDIKVVEAVGSGVREITLTEFMTECESFTIHGGLTWDQKYRSNMAAISRTFIGKPYDRSFKFGIEALYCSELTMMCDFEKRCLYDFSDLAGIGQDYISPKGVVEAVGMIKYYDSLVSPRILAVPSL